MNFEGYGIYNFGRGFIGLYDYEFSFIFRYVVVEKILEIIVKFCYFWFRFLGFCKFDKNYEINN